MSDIMRCAETTGRLEYTAVLGLTLRLKHLVKLAAIFCRDCIAPNKAGGQGLGWHMGSRPHRPKSWGSR